MKGNHSKKQIILLKWKAVITEIYKIFEANLAIICGSRLRGLVDIIDETDCEGVKFKCEDIPGFVTSTG